ncbi:MAG: rod shape-determining protein [Patescibacteria group bacterium]|nr:rod shape-determining protein [Patescibacteria group bacterium]
MSNFIGKLSKLQLPFFSSLHAYFDMGTSQTRIAVREKGVVFREATYIGLNTRTKEYIFFGNEAKTILGKTPDFIRIDKPIVNGILSDFDGEVAYLSYAIDKAINPYISQHFLIKPTVSALTSAPSIATEIEKRAVEESLTKAGCRSVTVIERAIATASGCGFNIFSHHPHYIIDMGAGLIELSIVSGGGIVAQKTLKNAGDHMNKQLASYVYMKHGIILGENSCEEIKKELLNFTSEEIATTVRGKSLETGLPKSVKLKTSDVKEALSSTFHQILDTTKELVEISPPEVADEVFQNGIALTGNMAAIPGIDHFFSKELKIETYVAKQYADATIHGLIHLDKNPDDLFKLVGYQQ